MAYKLAIAAKAAKDFGAAMVKGATVRQAFCVAMVQEIIAAPLQSAAIVEAAKAAAKYDSQSDADKALFRKQVQYIGTIAAAWPSLDAEKQKAFLAGEVPASTLEKEIKAPEKAAKAEAKEQAAKAEAKEQEQAQAKSDAAAARVITPAEMAVITAGWIDSLSLGKISKAETKALSMLLDAVEAFKARASEEVAQPAKIAA